MPERSVLKRYRLLPLIAVGALVLVILVLLAIFIWAAAAFNGQQDPAQSGGTAALIYLAAVFIACAVMTLLTRGGTVLPSAILGLLTVVISLFLAPTGAPLGKALLKVLLTMVAAIAGFTVAKLFCRVAPSGRSKPLPVKQRESLSTWEEESSSMSEPGK